MTFGLNKTAAEERLSAQIRDALNAAVNVRTVKQVVSSERADIMDEILANVARRAAPLGVDVVDVRLIRIDFSPEISESVYRRMEAERKEEANRLRATGAAESERIRAQADREREEILAKAYADSQNIRGEGDADAAALYSETYSKNPDFYSFYRSLESYRSAFSNKNDTLVISPDTDFFRFWGNPQGGPVQEGASGR